MEYDHKTDFDPWTLVDQDKVDNDSDYDGSFDGIYVRSSEGPITHAVCAGCDAPEVPNVSAAPSSTAVHPRVYSMRRQDSAWAFDSRWMCRVWYETLWQKLRCDFSM